MPRPSTTSSPGVRRADADHQDDVDVDVASQQRAARGRARRAASATTSVRASIARRSSRSAATVARTTSSKCGAVGVDDVVVPVGGEQRPVAPRSSAGRPRRGPALSRIGEEVGQQVDQHLRPGPGGGSSGAPGGRLTQAVTGARRHGTRRTIAGAAGGANKAARRCAAHRAAHAQPALSSHAPARGMEVPCHPREGMARSQLEANTALTPSPQADGSRSRTDDHAATDRTPVPGLRDALPLAGRGVDEFLRRQAHGLPRARRRHAAAAVPRAHVQSLRLHRRRARLHRGGGGDADAARARVERARAASSARRRSPAREKYEAAAKVAEWQGLEPRHVADLLLRAAWCCVDEGDIEAERFFRRKAAWAFERGARRASTAWRARSARCSPTSSASCGAASATPKRARDWFDRVPAEVVGPGRRSSG